MTDEESKEIRKSERAPERKASERRRRKLTEPMKPIAGGAPAPTAVRQLEEKVRTRLAIAEKDGTLADKKSKAREIIFTDLLGEVIAAAEKGEYKGTKISRREKRRILNLRDEALARAAAFRVYEGLWRGKAEEERGSIEAGGQQKAAEAARELTTRSIATLMKLPGVQEELNKHLAKMERMKRRFDAGPEAAKRKGQKYQYPYEEKGIIYDSIGTFERHIDWLERREGVASEKVVAARYGWILFELFESHAKSDYWATGRTRKDELKLKRILHIERGAISDVIPPEGIALLRKPVAVVETKTKAGRVKGIGGLKVAAKDLLTKERIEYWISPYVKEEFGVKEFWNKQPRGVKEKFRLGKKSGLPIVKDKDCPEEIPWEELDYRLVPVQLRQNHAEAVQFDDFFGYELYSKGFWDQQDKEMLEKVGVRFDLGGKPINLSKVPWSKLKWGPFIDNIPNAYESYTYDGTTAVATRKALCEDGVGLLWRLTHEKGPIFVDERVIETKAFGVHIAAERTLAEMRYYKSELMEIQLRQWEQIEARTPELVKLINLFCDAGGDAEVWYNLYSRQLNREGQAGLLQNPNSPGQIAYILRRIYRNRPEIWSQMGIRENSEELLNEAAEKILGWTPERRGENFYQWLRRIEQERGGRRDVITKAELAEFIQYGMLEKEWRELDLPPEVREGWEYYLKEIISDRNLSRNIRDELAKARRTYKLMRFFSLAAPNFGYFQKMFFEEVIKGAMDYGEANEENLHFAEIAFRNRLKGILLGLRDYDERGDRLQEWMAGEIMLTAKERAEVFWKEILYLVRLHYNTIETAMRLGDPNLIASLPRDHELFRWVDQQGNIHLMDRHEAVMTPEDRGRIIGYFEQLHFRGKGLTHLTLAELQRMRERFHCTRGMEIWHRFKMRWLYNIRDKKLPEEVQKPGIFARLDQLIGIFPPIARAAFPFPKSLPEIAAMPVSIALAEAGLRWLAATTGWNFLGVELGVWAPFGWKIMAFSPAGFAGLWLVNRVGVQWGLWRRAARQRWLMGNLHLATPIWLLTKIPKIGKRIEKRAEKWRWYGILKGYNLECHDSLIKFKWLSDKAGIPVIE